MNSKQTTVQFAVKNYNYETGIFCDNCKIDGQISLELTKELFNSLRCLSFKNREMYFEDNSLDKIVRMLEKFLKNNIREFKGLKSLELI